VAVARSSSDGVAIRYVLLVMFQVMGPMARHVYAFNSTTVPPRPKVTIEH